MAENPNGIVIKHILNGDFLAASEVVAAHGLPGQTELIRTAEFLSVTSWLAANSEAMAVRLEAQAVLQAVAGVSSRWVENAVPRPPVASQIPRSKVEFDRLMVQALGDRGYYHPIRLPTVDAPIRPNRANVRSTSVAYHTAEWTLVRRLLERACGGSLADKVVVDLGSADGFFSLSLAQAGARVIAIDIAVTMILRTATFAALNGLHRQVQARLGPTTELRAMVDRIGAEAPDFAPIDTICALGLIYHFDDLTTNLTAMAEFRVPILFEFHAALEPEEDSFDPALHRNPQPVSAAWLTDWLRDRRFEVMREPAWNGTAANLGSDGKAPRQEMLLALPLSR